MAYEPKPTQRCSFCGKSQHEVLQLFSSPKVSALFCDECALKGVEIAYTSTSKGIPSKVALYLENKEMRDELKVLRDRVKQFLTEAMSQHGTLEEILAAIDTRLQTQSPGI